MQVVPPLRLWARSGSSWRFSVVPTSSSRPDGSSRALALEYPDREDYADVPHTYLLGDHLLVGVFSPTVTIPPGVWREWRTDEPVQGPCERPVRADWTWGGALYVREGAVIPMWPLRQYLEKGWNEVVHCHVWPGAEGSFELYEDDGISLGYRRGEGARTKLSLVRGSDGKMRFLVGPRRGSYAGMPKTRRFRVVVHDGGPTRQLNLGEVGDAGASVEVR